MSHPKARSTDELIVMPVDDELLIYDQTQDKGHSLNPTAAFVWQHCDGETSPTELATMLEENFNTTEGEKLISMTLERLQKANLLTDQFAASNSISRREMLRLAGRAGMAVALLPVVSSIVAPTPAHAMSGGGGGVPDNCIFQFEPQFVSGMSGELATEALAIAGAETRLQSKIDGNQTNACRNNCGFRTCDGVCDGHVETTQFVITCNKTSDTTWQCTATTYATCICGCV